MNVSTFLDIMEIFLRENAHTENPEFKQEVVLPTKALYDKIRDWGD